MKKILVVETGGACDAAAAPTLAELAQVGWCGATAPGAGRDAALARLREAAAAAGRRVVVAGPGAPPAESAFAAASGRPWDVLHVVARADGVAADARAADAGVAQTLAEADGDVAALVLCGDASASSSWILAGAGVAPGTSMGEVRIEDLCATLAELAGLAPDAAPGGRSLVPEGAAAGASVTADEEAEMREHLRGLGYL